MQNANWLGDNRRLHLNKLRDGVEAWNHWREENPNEQPFLNSASLGTLNLAGANLSNALLRWADLNHADLSQANLQNADLHAASMLNVIMPGAILRNANLSAAIVNGDLRRVDLTGAKLAGTQFYGSLLTQANFRDVTCQSTVFASLDLSSCTGLEQVNHWGPSTLGIDTIYLSRGNISEVFLKGAGLPDAFVAKIPELIEIISPAQFYSCFISYSHDDQEFGRWLHDKLRRHGIRCWRDEKQLLPGDDIYAEVDRGIRNWDKVLLCCSKESLTSWWVDNEIGTALEKEQQLTRERGRKVQSIIPLNLDDYIFSTDWTGGYRAQIRRRLAANFTGWKLNHEAKFHEEIETLIRALRADQAEREKPPDPKL